MCVTRQRISNELWKVLEPLLPERPRSPKDGRPRIDDQTASNGILVVLHTGIPWEDLPQQMGFGSGMSCWRRRRDWQNNGVWTRLHLTLLTKLCGNAAIDCPPASINGAGVAPPRGANRLGRTRPTGACSVASVISR
jgi:transposase